MVRYCAIMECKVLHQTSPESPWHQPKKSKKKKETIQSSRLRKMMLHSHSEGQAQLRDYNFLIFRDITGSGGVRSHDHPLQPN